MRMYCNQEKQPRHLTHENELPHQGNVSIRVLLTAMIKIKEIKIPNASSLALFIECDLIELFCLFKRPNFAK